MASKRPGRDQRYAGDLASGSRQRGPLLELFGVAGAGLVGAISGGLFELTFGIWLIARGFASTATAVRSRAST